MVEIKVKNIYNNCLTIITKKEFLIIHLDLIKAHYLKEIHIYIILIDMLN